MFKKSNMDNNESQEESEMLWLYPADREKLNFKPNCAMLKICSQSGKYTRLLTSLLKGRGIGKIEDNSTSADPPSYTTTIIIPGRPSKLSQRLWRAVLGWWNASVIHTTCTINTYTINTDDTINTDTIYFHCLLQWTDPRTNMDQCLFRTLRWSSHQTRRKLGDERIKGWWSWSL